MIKTNGYYLLYPTFYTDHAGSHEVKGFFHIAYKFDVEKEMFYKAVKRSENVDEEFIESDFSEDQNNKFSIKDNVLTLTFDYDREWKHDEEVKIYRSDILCKGEKVLRFKNWKN